MIVTNGLSVQHTHLGVLVDEHEGVRNVVVAEVNDAAPHPALHATLCVVKNLLLFCNDVPGSVAMDQ